MPLATPHAPSVSFIDRRRLTTESSRIRHPDGMLATVSDLEIREQSRGSWGRLTLQAVNGVGRLAPRLNVVLMASTPSDALVEIADATLRLTHKDEVLGEGRVFAQRLFDGVSTVIEVPTTLPLVRFVTASLTSTATTVDIQATFRGFGAYTLSSERKATVAGQYAPVGQRKVFELETSSPAYLQIERTKWFATVVTTTHALDFHYTEVYLPPVANPAASGWRQALERFHAAERSYALGDDASVFLQLRGALDSLPGAKKDIVASVANERKRKALDALLIKGARGLPPLRPARGRRRPGGRDLHRRPPRCQLRRRPHARDVGPPVADPRRRGETFGAAMTETESFSRVEIVKLVNRYVGVEGGYLVSFGYRTLEEFYPEYCGFEADPSLLTGTTRERFINVLETQSPRGQAAVLRGLIARCPPGQAGAPTARTEQHRDELLRRADQLEGTAGVADPVFTTATVRMALDDADILVTTRGPTNAVDRVHTALHGWLRAAAAASGVATAAEASMPAILKAMRSDTGPLADLGLRGDDVAKVLNASASILDALLPLRNRASLAHPNDELLDAAEARLIINVARSLLLYFDTKISVPAAPAESVPEPEPF
jgi:hypothetical protein